MNIGIQTSTPVVFGVLTCLNEAQVVERATPGSKTNNHGYDWGKTAVEMALLRTEAMGGKAADTPLKDLGFGLKTGDKAKEKKAAGFF
jgi:6,7-dimethyl-8-ribityllumazine synthase